MVISLTVISIFICLIIIALVVFAVIKRINASKRMGELTIFADRLKKTIAQSADTKLKNSYEKKLKKIERKIEDLRLLTIPKKCFSQTDQLRYRLKISHRLLVATTIIALIVFFFALGFYDDLIYYREDNSNLCEEIGDLQAKIGDLEYKAESLDWYAENTRLLIADEGALHNTYHKFGCEKVYEAKGIKIISDGAVIDNPKYIKCPDCNGE